MEVKDDHGGIMSGKPSIEDVARRLLSQRAKTAATSKENPSDSTQMSASEEVSDEEDLNLTVNFGTVNQNGSLGSEGDDGELKESTVDSYGYSDCSCSEDGKPGSSFCKVHSSNWTLNSHDDSQQGLTKDNIGEHFSVEQIGTDGSFLLKERALPEAKRNGTKKKKKNSGTVKMIHENIGQKKKNNKELLFKYRLTETGKRIYYCELCDKDFTSCGSLSRHKTMHSGERPFKCNICGKGFVTHSEMMKHQVVHTNWKPYQCDICFRTFNHSSTVKTHKRTHFGVKPYQCDLCLKKFTQLSNLNAHKKIHASDRPFQCNSCIKTFSTFTELEEHGLIHEMERPYECDVCEKNFKAKVHLETHKKIHSAERATNVYQCNFCGEVFERAFTLTLHKRTHPADNEPFKCEFCSKRFFEFENLKTHKRIHTGERPFLCGVCPKAFISPSHLQIHKVLHLNETLLSKLTSKLSSRKMHRAWKSLFQHHQCGLCGKRFYSYFHFKGHKKLLHSSKKPYQCKTCSKTFNLNVYLYLHAKNHKKKKASQAQNVFMKDSKQKVAQFNVKESKQNVAQSNTKESTAYMCNVCGKSFNCYNHLCTHKLIHASKSRKAHKCNVCGKIFTRNYTLLRHQKSHGIEVPKQEVQNRDFECGLCNKGFATLVNLNRHLRRYHKLGAVKKTEVQLYECEGCNRKFNTSPFFYEMHQKIHCQQSQDSIAFAGVSSTQNQLTTQTDLGLSLLSEYQSLFPKGFVEENVTENNQG